jgi:hypothetical protein
MMGLTLVIRLISTHRPKMLVLAFTLDKAQKKVHSSMARLNLLLHLTQRNYRLTTLLSKVGNCVMACSTMVKTLIMTRVATLGVKVCIIH